MDQNSSNDAEKRNWRERLGISTREMPKIAGEFSKPVEPVLVIPKSKDEAKEAKPDAPAVVVAKPAPMAPRVAGKAPAAPRPAASSPRPSPASGSSPGRPQQPSPPQAPDVLAERLRNQREAAEKLAEQRVNNAKERAASNKEAQASQPAASAPPQQAPRGRQDTGNKPKFSFAEDEVRSEPKRDPRAVPPLRPSGSPTGQTRPPATPAPQNAQSIPPQMTPARPPLGGNERFVAPQVPPPMRQPPPAAKPSFGPTGFRPQAPGPVGPGPGYRPIDPASGYAPAPSFQMPRGTMAPPPGPRPAAMPGSLGGDPRLQGGSYIGADPYAPSQGGLPRYDQLARPPAPRTDQLRPQTHSYDGDLQDDIFEDAPQKPTRRASVNDYSQAYNPDMDMDYQPRGRRSGGPLLLLLLLGIGAVACIAAVLYYQNVLKAGGGTTAGGAPVVTAPAEAPKSAAETVGTQPPQGGTSSATPTKKQIYDRIIGDKEVLGGANQVVPTEEAPVQPALDQNTQPAAVPPPATSGQAEEPLPLPMPPPLNGDGQSSGTQGALPVPQPAGTTTVADGGAAVTGTGTGTGYTSEQQQQMAAVSQPKSLTEDPSAASPEQLPAATGNDDQQAEAPAPVKPAKPKAAAKPKPKKKVERTVAQNEDLGAEPVVLVPDQNAGGSGLSTDPQLSVDEPVLQQGAAPVEQPVKKKKTLLGLFTGENKNIEEDQGGGIDAATQQQAPARPARQQVAAVAPKPQAVPDTGGTATGFNLALASFSSQKEAQAEYQRVASRHGGIIGGLSPVITPVSVGGSTRYRLSLGPVATSAQAQTMCRNLNAAGVPDCTVRRR